MRKADQMQDDEMDDLFAELRARPPGPSAGLMERVLSDALREQPQPAPRPAVAPTAPRPWAQLWSAIAGLPALAGVSAAVVGLVIGYADPSTVDVLTGELSSYSLGDTELFPAADFLVEG
jgi:hypothetical protein